MSGDLKERIEALLAGLGDTADAVADSLRAKGIKGNRDDGCECPVANLIYAEVEESHGGNWSDSAGGWFVSGAYIRTPDGDIDPPRAVTEFIEAFDNGSGDIWSEGHEWPYEDLEDR